jgi:hypothetical protein
MLVILIGVFLFGLISSVDPDSDLALRQVHEESLNLANQVVEQSKVRIVEQSKVRIVEQSKVRIVEQSKVRIV